MERHESDRAHKQISLWATFRGRQLVATFLVVLLAAPTGEAIAQQAPSTQQQLAPAAQQPQSAPPDDAKTPDSYAGNRSTASQATPAQSADPASPQVPNQSQQPATEQQPPKPVGTAAAPYEKLTGVPGSRPAGAVIAPAKQRRAHSFLIRFVIVAGAAVAVGTVVGLSSASHSRPQ